MRRCSHAILTLLTLIALASSGCTDATGANDWGFTDDADDSSTDIASEWQKLQGPHTTGVRFQMDGKLFAYDLVNGVDYRPDITHFTTDIDNWHPVDDSPLGSLIEKAHGASYAETDSHRYLMRRTPGEPREWAVEMFRAPIGSSNFDYVDATDEFERVPALFSVGDKIVAFTWRDGRDHYLFRLHENDPLEWRKIGPPPSTDGQFHDPVAVQDQFFVSNSRSHAPPTLHAYDIDSREWSSISRPTDFAANVAESLAVQNQLVSIGFSEQTESGEWHTRLWVRHTDGTSRVHTLRTSKPLSVYSLIEYESSVYLFDEMGRLLRIAPGEWSVERTDAGICPEVRSNGASLVSIRNSLICTGRVGDLGQIRRWKPGQNSWKTVEFGAHRPSDLIIHNGAIHDLREGAIFQYRDETEDWSVDIPPIATVGPTWIVDDTRLATNNGCVTRKHAGRWRLLRELYSGATSSLDRCFTDRRKFRRATSIAAFQDGFAISVTDVVGDNTLKLLNRDGSTMNDVPRFRDAFDRDLPDGSLTSVGNSLWVETSRNNVSSPEDAVAFRLKPGAGWEIISATLNTPGEQGGRDRIHSLTAAPTSPDRLWATIYGRVETEHGRAPDRLAFWSKPQNEFELLPPPPPGNLEARQAMKVTNRGALAATNNGIFKWSFQRSTWVQLVDDLPTQNSDVIDLAADANRLAIALHRGDIWQHGLDPSSHPQ